jgi:hypothetical protein
MPADLARVKELFVAVLEMSAAERAAYLDTACGGDTTLRQQIEAMLRSHEHSGELLSLDSSDLHQDGGATQADATSAFLPNASNSATMHEHNLNEPTDLRFLAPVSKPGLLGQLGPYEVQTTLGRGGFGIVLKGFDERLHRVVAIKVLSPAYSANGAARARFLREARAAAAVKNEHVVGIYDVQGDADPPYLVMEYIEGVSLQDKLDRHGAASVKEILRVGMQIAEGLEAAHKQGLVHRDIKPANILLENGVERVKITDFGLARAVDDASVTQSGTVAGTPMFMSPEQAEGAAIDHRSDLFSLGTVLYAMCTGHPPFRATSTMAVLKRVIEDTPRPIRDINNEIPEWLCDIITKLHAKNPEDRFQSAREVADVLGARLADVQAGRAIEGRAEPRKGPVEAPAPAPLHGAPSMWPTTLAGVVLGIVFGLATGLADPERFWVWGQTPLWLGVIYSAGMGAAVGVLLGFLRIVLFARIAWEVRNAGNQATPTTRRRRTAFRWLGSGVAVIVVTILSVWVLPNWWRGTGTLELQSNDARVQLTISSQGGSSTKTLAANSDLQVPAGFYHVEASSGSEHRIESISVTDLAFQKRTFQNGVNKEKMSIRVEKGQRTFIDVHVEPKDAGQPGWVQLFNGKDLTGWKKHPTQPGDWRVENDELVCRASPGYLFTERGDWQDFHLRAELFMSSGGNSGIFFRTPFALEPAGTHLGQKLYAPTGWYEADIFWTPQSYAGRIKGLAEAKEKVGGPDQWLALEIIARGNRFETRINGKTIVDVVDSKATFSRGHLALQAFTAATAVRFKKIEIKELVPEQPGWVQLFNGKDRDGWKAIGHDGWRVENGVLIGETKGTDVGWLMSQREYTDFELKLDYRLSARSNSGVFLRAWPEGPVNGSEFLEIQLIDDQLIKDPRAKTGAIYGAVAPKEVATPTGQWHHLEIRIQNRLVKVEINGSELTAANLDDYKHLFGRFPGLNQAKGRIGLQVYPSRVEFRKIEIKELPPSLPQKSADIPRFVAGAWKIESTIVEPKLPPEQAKMTGVNVFEPICGGKFLRGFTSYGDGQFESLIVQQYEQATDTVRGWFFSSKGENHGPGVGRWNPERRTMLWLEKLPNGLHAAYEYEFADVNTIKTRVFYQNDKNEVVFELRSVGTRLPGPVELKPAPIDPQRPAEMKILDRLVGAWRNDVNLRRVYIANPDKRVTETQHVKAGHVLGGRFIESFITTEAKNTEDYALAWYDVGAKKYHQLHFGCAGTALEMLGSWNQEEKILTWNSPDGRLVRQWTFKNDDLREFVHRFIDKRDGPVTETSGVSQRIGPGWVQLFNGKDLTGWKGGKGPDGGLLWKWEESMLAARGRADNQGEPLVSTKIYRDFEMRFQVRALDAMLNLRLRDDKRGATTVTLGSAVGKNETWGRIAPRTQDMAKANQLGVEAAFKDIKQGEFNDVFIRFVGKRLNVSINGVTTYDGDTLSSHGAGALDWSIYGNGRAWIRNAGIRELPPEEPGWVQLFNGKDLDGWKFAATDKGQFRVKDGLLIARGNAGLRTERADYADFHFRVEAKMKATTDPKNRNNGTMAFRSDLVPHGYLAYLNGPSEIRYKCGSLFAAPLSPGSFRLLTEVSEEIVAYDTWFTQEVIAKGPHIKIKINGKTVVDTMDGTFAKGRLGLGVSDLPGATADIIWLKRIEVKELPTK